MRKKRVEGEMSLIPAFELGFLNAWILILPLLLLMIITQLIMKKRREHHEEESLLDINMKRLMLLGLVISVVFYVYSIFLPLELGKNWFYVGFIIYLFGWIVGIIALENFVTTHKDQPVTKGIYRISRNPMYLGGFLIYVGISLTSGSWIFLIYAIAYIIFQNFWAKSEERFCLNKYGDAYREYMSRTPKWIGIQRSSKSD